MPGILPLLVLLSAVLGAVPPGHHPPNDGIVLIGWFHTICFDDPEGRSGVRHFLIDAAGNATNLTLAPDVPGVIPSAGDLSPRFAEVSGEWIDGAGLRVTSVRFISPPFRAGLVRQSATLPSLKSGPQPWLIILCKFPDVSDEPRTPGFYQAMFASTFPGIDHYWREVSYDVINLGAPRVVGWYVLPHPRSYYVYGDSVWPDQGRTLLDATAVADRDVYFPAYAGITMVFNDFFGAKYAAYGGIVRLPLDGVQRTWGATWHPADLFHGVYGHERNSSHYGFAHEIGHAFGLPHSSAGYGGTYDNYWDVMSHWASRVTDPEFGLQAIHTNAYHKDLLGWIRPDEKYTALPGTQKTIQLERLALPMTRAFKMAQIPLPGLHEHFYTAEARQRVGYDTGLYGDAVILYDVDPDRIASGQWGLGSEWRPAHVMDPDMNEFTGDEGPMFVPGRLFQDPGNGVSIAVESAYDTGFTVTINNNARFIAHLANGAGIRSTLVLVNPSATQQASGTVSLFSTGGTPLRLAINGVPRDGLFDFALPPGGSAQYFTDGQGELITGSIEVGSDSPVDASIVLAGTSGIAGLSASSLATTSLVLPVSSDRSTGIRGGIALSNPNSEEIVVAMQLRATDGEPVPGAQTSVRLVPHGQFMKYADEMFPAFDLTEARGTLLATSSLPFNGVAMLQAESGQFTTLPVGPVDRLSKPTPVGIVSTYAGEAGSRGSADGALREARFASPNDIAADRAGNLYVADTASHTIRKISALGVVTTVAGLAGSSGAQDGIGGSARFNTPRSLCADGAGNIFIADYGNHTIRKLAANGTVTTIAGSAGEQGSADGSAAAARFNYPRGIAIDASGTIYVSDTSNHTIRKIAPGGSVTTIAGLAGVPGYADGTGENARFDGQQRIALDSRNNLLVADYNNCVIRKISPEGIVTTLAGTPGLHGGMNGPPETALFGYPMGLAIDSSDGVYVSDGWVVRHVTRDGFVTTLAGSSKINTTPNTSLSGNADGAGTAARFAIPSGLAVDPSGTIFVADRDNHTIRRISKEVAAEPVYFSQFVNGEGLASTLILVNPSLSQPCAGILKLRGSQGQSLGVTFNGIWTDGNYPFNLAPGAALWLATDGLGPLAVGSVEMKSEIPVRSALLFSGVLGLGGLAASRPAARQAVPLDIDSSAYLEAGIALSNPGADTVSISLTLTDTNGLPIVGARAETTLAGYAQIARFPAELFAGKPVNLAKFRGTLVIEASQPICAMALRLSPAGMAALPVIP